MAINITVYPQYSPRIIEILSPATEATVQDIVNACRDWENLTDSMGYDALIDAAGKEDLGGGVLVGITATLQNAQVSFEARGISDSAGSVTTADTTGRFLTDSTATFETDLINPGDTVYNKTDGSIATVLNVISETALECFPLEDGTDDDWDMSDEYKIWNKVQCEVSGGNLVAVDENGATMSAFLPSALTHVVRTSSSSATLSDLDAIQYSSYDGGVSLDITSSNSGTSYPVGNQEYPVNNLTDAVTIANTKGFHQIFVRSSMTGVNKFDAGSDVSDFIISGLSRSSTTIEVDTSTDTTNTIFEHCTIYGTLDGGNTLRDCDVGEVLYFNGRIENCGLFGTIELEGNEEAIIEGCMTIDQDNPPMVDMGGSGQDLAMPNYSGIVTITNLTSPTEEVGIGLSGGLVTLDSTITAGVIIISGNGVLTDNSTSVTYLDYDSLMNKGDIADAILDEPLAGHTTAGSFGEKVGEKLATLLDLISLR